MLIEFYMKCSKGIRKAPTAHTIGCDTLSIRVKEPHLNLDLFKDDNFLWAHQWWNSHILVSWLLVGSLHKFNTWE